MTDAKGVVKNEPAMSDLTIDAPVCSVVVFEDRAQVVRRGLAELPTGLTTVRIENIAPIVADRTLQAKLSSAPGGALVSDIRVERDFRSVIDPEKPEADGVEKRLREVTAEQNALLYEKSAVENQLSLVEQMTQQALDDLATDVAWGNSHPDEWRKGLGDLADRESALRIQLLDLQRQIEDTAEKHEDLLYRSHAADRPDKRITAELVVQIVNPKPAEVEIEVAYVVPSACWRPLHTARLEATESADNTVNFSTDGCVWQNTGEDWHDVRLQFSTQRPSLGFEPPLLGEDVLVSREKPEAVVVEARDQVITTTGLGSSTETADGVPGVDDGGVPVTVEAGHTASVPSDGMPYRVKIAEFSSDATVGLVSVAELNPCAHTKVTLDHRGKFPILAGPVELIRDHGIVGKTSVLFVAPGERFRLGFGPDPAIRVRRKVAEVEQQQTPLSRYVSTEHAVTILVCNIGDDTKQLHFTERIPVSEVEQVVIDFDASESTVESKPDEDGHIKWEIVLPPGGRETRLIRYAVKKRKAVVG